MTFLRKRSATWGPRAFFIATALTAGALGCAKPTFQPLRPDTSNAPTWGLFKVVDRSCENAFDEPDNCPLIDYVELTHSTLPSLAEHPAVQIFWLKPQPGLPRYTYEIWPLSGRYANSNEYVLHDEGAVRDWLVLRDGEVHAYELESYRTEQRREIRLRAHLSLVRVTRTAKIDELLQLDQE